MATTTETKTTCTTCGTPIPGWDMTHGVPNTVCERCRYESRLCPDCGTFIDIEPSIDAFCHYCYVQETKYTIKVGHKAYVCYGSDERNALIDRLIEAGEYRWKETSKEVLRSNPNPDSSS
jgi:NMD protein affecting ribosome stability and mRNA decay